MVKIFFYINQYLEEKMSVELRKIKKRLGWTNADVAKAIGVSESGVDHWFRTNDAVTVNEPVIRLMRLIDEVINHSCGSDILKNAGIQIKEQV
tara:strand:+ start:321 stop:599 length:279 start_codon:yes stop_codon:yes gene_type:complete